jgi:RimJ/RimL family protein N-acetyltransferase
VLSSIASARLHLSPVSDDDIGLMRRLNADEAVMRNLTGRPATAEETRAEWAERLLGRSDPGRGLGYWIGRADGVFVGWWGLGACSWEPGTANLGYRLSPAQWGRGLATEGSRALLRHAFDEVGLATVWASTSRSNRASQRVLAKLPMRYVGVRYDQIQFEITAAEWAEAARP